MKNVLLFIIYCFLISQGQAQTDEWINYSKSTDARCMIDDEDHIWIGTQAGLVKYDKTTGQSQIFNASNSGLPENTVAAIAKDQDGKLWISTMFEGVVTFDNQYWEEVENVNNYLSGSGVNDIYVDANNIKWMASSLGLIKVDGVSMTVYNAENSDIPANDLFSLQGDNYGNLWIGTFGLIKYTGTDWELFTSGNDGLPMGIFYAIEQGNNNDLWGTCGPHLVKIDSTGFTTYSSPKPINHFHTVAIDQNDSVFMGIWDGDYSYQRFYQGTWDFFDCNNGGITNCQVRQVTVDKNNNKWFAGDQGLDVLTFNNSWQFNEISNSPLPGNNIRSIAIGNNGMNYFKTSNGVVGYDWNNWDEVIQSNKCDYICYDNYDNLLMANPRNIFIYDGQEIDTLITPFVGSPVDWVECVTTDLDNHIWMTFPNDIYNYMIGGVFKYDGSQWETFTKENSGLPASIVNDITVDGFNNVWFATEQGVARYYEGQWTVFDQNNSLIPYNSIHSITVDSVNKIWISMPYATIASFDGVHWTVYDSPIYPIISGLSDLTIDSKGNLWGVSLNKIAKFDLTNWEYFDHENSPLPHNNTWSLAIDRNDNVFVGTNLNGLYIFNGDGIIPVSIDDFENIPKKEYSIFPNPTNGIVNVELVSGNTKQLINIIVYDMSGLNVYSTQQYGKSLHILDLRSYSNGIYTLRIEYEPDKFVTKKIIKL